MSTKPRASPQVNHRVALLSIPFDANSSYERGAAKAPAEILRAFECESSNTWAESGIDVRTALGDAVSLDFKEAQDPMELITGGVQGILKRGAVPISLGGDHSITFPLVRAFAARYPELTILHFDAHPDLYDSFQDNRYSHACPFARIMEAGLAKRLIQVGIRTINDHQREQARRFGVEVIEMRRWDRKVPAIRGPVYVSFDMDVLDPAFAPGVSHPEPGGLSTREATSAIQNLKGQIVGADLVELNPRKDPSGLSAMCAAKILKELIGRIATRR